MASIKDIAKEAGVSVSTVSRVLNNPDYKCSTPGLRDKIWNAAMRMNYVPNEAARNLKSKSQSQTQKTYYINVLMTRMDTAGSDPFFRELLTTVEISKTDMGKFALYLLIDRLRGGHKGVARVELQCRLLKRESCTLAEESKWCEYYI